VRYKAPAETPAQYTPQNQVLKPFEIF
jgi:hypothetical protein